MSDNKSQAMHALAYHQRGHFHDGRHFVNGEHSTGAKTAIVLLTSVAFALDHYTVQGLAGAEQVAITRLVFGTIAQRRAQS